jgi:hypothetical protein
MESKPADQPKQPQAKVRTKDLEAEYDKLAAFLFDMYKKSKRKEYN